LNAGKPARLAAGAEPIGRKEAVERIAAGGFPEALARSGARRHRWFDAYLDTMLQRDVRDIAEVAGLTEMPRLMLLLAARATGLVKRREAVCQ
jgi:predicted AAA+ superfamily ATPase